MISPAGGTFPTLDETQRERSPSSEGDPRLTLALDEYLAALRSGPRPNRAAFLGRHPEIAEALDACLDALEFIQSAAFEEPRDGPDPPHEWSTPAATLLGDFRIIRELGRGGMGIVYEAEQVSLTRRVALKVLPFGSSIDPRRLRRFQIEAQAAAHLNHPHIVPIFVVGSDHGVNYYAMRFIEGQTLADVVRGLRNSARVERPAGDGGATVDAGPAAGLVAPPLASGSSFPHASRASFRVIARLGLQAAEALDHAHSLGVIHRDIKPANLMVDDHGAIWVTDFGLARFEAAAGPTRSGDLIGTIRYMSPEQASAGGGLVDQRTDIYSLGATLYELTTLRPAFDGQNREELLRKLVERDPAPPRKFEPALPRDLETIILKAMATEPSSRYTTAQELADDLKRFLADEPVRARRPGVAERMARWAKRHRTAVATASATLILAASVAAGLLWLENRKTSRAYDQIRSLLDRQRASLPTIFATTNGIAMKAMEKVSLIDRAVSGKEDADFYRLVLRYYDAIARLTQDDPDPRMREVAAKAYFGVGVARTLLGRPGAEEAYARSVAAYEGLIENDSGNPNILLHLAISISYLGRDILSTRGLAPAEPTFRRAADVLRDLASRDPSSRVYLAAELTNWGRILAGAGRRAEAERAFLEAVEADPNSAEAKDALAMLLVSRPDLPPYDPARAVALAQTAVARDATQTGYWTTLGIALVRGDDWDAADQAIARSTSLSKHGGEPLDWLCLSLIHSRRGDFAQARTLLDRSDAWLKAHEENDPDLLHFRAEAAARLDLSSRTRSGATHGPRPSPVLAPSSRSCGPSRAGASARAG